MNNKSKQVQEQKNNKINYNIFRLEKSKEKGVSWTCVLSVALKERAENGKQIEKELPEKICIYVYQHKIEA